MAPLPFDFVVRSVPLHAMGSYPSWPREEVAWRNEDYAANCMIRCIKMESEKIKARYVNWPNGRGGYSRFDRNNMPAAQDLFAAWAAGTIRDAGVENPVFVPVPNRNALAGAATFNCCVLAQKIARAFGNGAQAFCGVRFREFHPKVDGETKRSRADLAANMMVVGKLPAGTLVIIDDVYSRGASVRAVSDVLKQEPALVVVAGRTDQEPIPHPLSPRVLDHDL